MTEYELADAISSYSAGGGTYFTIWLTILSAYAITAYIAGKDFTSFQIMWLNTLYLFALALSIVGFYGQFNAQVFYVQVIKELNPASPQFMNSSLLMSIAMVAVLGTLITLKFMWDVRHRKTE